MSGGRAPSQIRDRIVGLRRVRADNLLPNPKNWRRHPKAQGDALEGLLTEIGYADALLARETPDGLMLIDGHLRAETTPKAKVPVLVLDVTEQEADKLLLTLDPLAAMAEMDGAATRALLEGVETESEGVRAMLAGLQDEAQRALGPQEGLTDPDAVPEPPEEPVSRPGDVWACGEHRVMCGDSTDAEDVARLMGGERAALMVTDPPYGVDVGKKYKMRSLDARGGPRFRQDGLTVPNDDLGDESTRELWTEGLQGWPLAGDAYVFCPPGPYILRLGQAIEAAGIAHHQWVIWAKQSFVLGGSHYHYRHEHIFYGWKGRSSWNGSRIEDSLWDAPKPNASKEHPTMKPVALCERAIENSSKAEDAVLDPFLGSGTTMIAAERLGRRCYGMEIEPRYVDAAIRRWEAFTGRKAELLHKTEAVSA
jgi:DNA modification methylase